MKANQARQIEQNHNVYVDAEFELYTNGEREGDYGWIPIPQEWIDETDKDK